MADITDRITEVLRRHKPTWRRIQHPKRADILVNVLACTGCEWVGEESDHDAHQAAVLVETLGLAPEYIARHRSGGGAGGFTTREDAQRYIDAHPPHPGGVDRISDLGYSGVETRHVTRWTDA
ncbi:hypothetical protein [Mycolicibacterium fortuitum]|uniref:hypothetical protein n=1 Tax=Mycolicibacterium fortuitum TaxID=1766 RepID=UPI003AB02720